MSVYNWVDLPLSLVVPQILVPGSGGPLARKKKTSCVVVFDERYDSPAGSLRDDEVGGCASRRGEDRNFIWTERKVIIDPQHQPRDTK